ncbi:hypothetical protein LTR36_005746 [Oleoguttula mirabilis]|uniref:HECT-type E3 ubiquitin transferase n=1 Tax=Oleoguttula mirabilis TaxID=1507867 RepID=A0AAV9JDI1_9PEZI|nr:hypothetical protein LTR36_005746 [Oleoguttula mirabilis]
MAPSWSSRLLSSGSSSSNTPTRSSVANSARDKPLPRPPPPTQVAFDPPPTLYGERAQPSPVRPLPTAGRQHQHGRSVSHPLPKIFGRKKSARELGGFNDTDVPLDDALVPVLDEHVAPVPTRVISGRKGGKPDDEGRVARRCMCCDSRVMVPKELEKFRCMGCQTINDLRPLAEQRDEREKALGRRAETFQGGGLPAGARPAPLSVERTRAIIDRCLWTYLEARCRKQEPPPPPPPMVASPTAMPSPDTEVPAHTIPITPSEADGQGKELTDAPITSSPPDTPDLDDTPTAHSATITHFTDIDLFSYMRIDTPPPVSQTTAHGPGPPSAPPPRKPSVPARPNRKPPPPPVNVTKGTPSQKPQPNGSTTPKALPSPRLQHSPRPTAVELKAWTRYDRVRLVFRPLEEYLMASFGDYQSLNTAFSTVRPVLQGRARSESSIKTPPPERADQPSPFDGMSELDAKTLLLGDLGENSSWWTGKLDRIRSDKAYKRKKVGDSSRKAVASKSPNINWPELDKWYDLIHTAGEDWQSKVNQVKSDDATGSQSQLVGLANTEDIEEELEEAREHAVRTLFKITEALLKRPSRPLTEPEHLRFLLIILANPSLYPAGGKPKRALSGASMQPTRSRSDKQPAGIPPASPKQLSPRKSPGRECSQHTGILKRVFGLLAHSSDTCHRYLIGWFARFDQDRFEHLVDLVASFVTHRISRRSGRTRSKSSVNDGGLIPDLSGSMANTSAQLHAAMGLSGSVKKRNNEPDGETDWADDWQIKAAAKLMSLLFAANNIWQGKLREHDSACTDSGLALSAHAAPAARARRSGQLLHTSQFYNLLLDYHDLIADFKMWESKRDKFAFCQYPLFLSMGAKIKVLEYDARRQMEIKAREAYFDSMIRQRQADGYFHLRVRRDCMVDDSLRQISEAAGAGQGEELKKGLRVHFTGEEGVDAGGPRKEWFLMVVRDIFDPNHGMFVYDDDSNTCYFNPNSFETSDQYYLVGALLGLAIYNSTILDVALPPFAFRKLLAAAPTSATNSSNVSSITGTKGQMTYTIADLAEFRPSLAAGLQQLLDFEGDVETTYCRDFVAPVEMYGTTKNVPLISNGEGTPVTNSNRQEFVDAYIRYLLDGSVARQFEPFKRGFFTVCAGNALSLFRAEEIELLIRGSDESLDVDSVRAVAVYENWKHCHPPHQMVPNPAETVPVIGWFWELFAQASPEKQRKLLTFITGTDRIPAVGATSLVLRIVAGGDGWGGGGKEERERFPVARTCFNMLVLWHYDHREALEAKLWRAVEESEGFGLK